MRTCETDTPVRRIATPATHQPKPRLVDGTRELSKGTLMSERPKIDAPQGPHRLC